MNLIFGMEVTPPFYASKISSSPFWPDFSLLTSSFFRWRHQKSVKITSFTPIVIKIEPLTVERRLTPQIKAVIMLFQKNDKWQTQISFFWWRQHFFSTFWQKWQKNGKMTSYDVTWRHDVRFSPNCQEIFILWILNFSEKIKSVGLFLVKLWPFSCFWLKYGISYIFSTSPRQNFHNFFSRHANDPKFSGNV